MLAEAGFKTRTEAFDRIRVSTPGLLRGPLEGHSVKRAHLFATSSSSESTSLGPGRLK